MKDVIFCTAGSSPALDTAAAILKDTYPVLPCPGKAANYLLLPVPAKGDGLDEALQAIREDCIVIGGNLSGPKYADLHKIDLLCDPMYLARNAAITAHCAVRLGMDVLPITMERCPILILGWGRIGKCLGMLLKQLGANVTIAARKETDRAMAASLGLHVCDTKAIQPGIYRLIYNTIPGFILPDPGGQVPKIDLASLPGLESSCVIPARGLPGRLAPESSGRLIAETVIHYLNSKEDSM